MVSVNQFLKLNNNKNNYIASRNTLRSISRNSYDKNMTKRIQNKSTKIHSCNTSASKNSKTSSQSKSIKKTKINATIFQIYDSNNRNKKNKKIADFVPQYLHKQTRLQKNNTKMYKNKRAKPKPTYNENKQNQTQNNIYQQKIILNKDLLSNSQKPNKINFMNRVSNVYDLIISRVMLPQFIQYFLGQALFSINHKSKYSGSQNFYDWRLDQFKKICQKIYQESEQQDLKFFMSLSLPNVSRWNSRMPTTKNTTAVSFKFPQTEQQQSRLSKTSNNQDRINYFRSLNKRVRQSSQQHQSTDILEKLHSKLDNYLKKNYEINYKQSQNVDLYNFPLKTTGPINKKFI